MEELTVNSVECSLCKYIVGYIDTIIQNNKSEAAIEAALEKVCTILPHALNHTCVQFVETYGPVLVQLIEKYGTPDLVCDALKLCKNGTEEAAETKSRKFLFKIFDEIKLFFLFYEIDKNPKSVEGD